MGLFLLTYDGLLYILGSSNFTIASLFASISSGAKGDVNDEFKFSKAVSLVIKISDIDIIPIKPNKLDDKMNKNLHTLIPFIKSES